MGPAEALGEAREPGQLLNVITGLQKRTRWARGRAGWFPLALFGAVLIGADRVYRRASGVQALAVPGGGFRDAKDHWFANIAGSPAHLPAAKYWVIAVPVAFVLAGLWLRWQSHHVGLRQPWLVLTLVGLLPFAALVVLRLLIEPNVASVHNVLQHESPSKWLSPLLCIALGVLAVGILERSKAIFTVCATVVAVNATVMLATSDGVRSGSWKERALRATLGRVHELSLAGLSGAVLVALATVWLLLSLNGLRITRGDHGA